MACAAFAAVQGLPWAQAAAAREQREVGDARREVGGKTGDRRQVGNLSSRRGEINVSIGNQHLYLPAWHLASSGKRVAINEAGNNKNSNKNKLPTAHNLRSTISTSLVSLCVMRVLPPESAIRSRAEQVIRACTLHIALHSHTIGERLIIININGLEAFALCDNFYAPR